MLRRVRQAARSVLGLSSHEAPSAEWSAALDRMACAERMIDLGCGARPHPKAVVGVDAFVDPVHRNLGLGPTIDAGRMARDGFQFILAELAQLPFRDGSFDFAYSHHVFEHLDDPRRACREMCRVADAGVIITPSPFAEIAFGRPYHLWLVFARGETLFFLRKRSVDDRPFGDHPNPFDVLLNDGGWYRGSESMPSLGRALRRHWYSHSPVMETVFLWQRSFECVVIEEDGTIG